MTTTGPRTRGTTSPAGARQDDGVTPPVTDSSPGRVSSGTVPRSVALAGLATAMGMVILDASMVNVALPAVRAGLGLSTTEQSWVVDGYLVAFAGLLLLGGRLADLLGGRRMFLGGLALYAVATAGSALAPSSAVLIASRVAAGAAGALLIPAALSIVVLLYPGADERRRALGIWGGVAGLGSLLGVGLSGLVVQILGWQAVFWIPVPVAVLIAVTVLLAIAPIPARAGGFDVIGAVTITVGTSALALGLTSATEVGWSSPLPVASLVLGVVALAAFVVAERRSGQPLVPPALFRRGAVVTGNA